MSTPVVKTAERAYTIVEAAELKSVSPDFIRAAIRRTDPSKGPVLPAKRVGRGYRINASALEAMWEGLADA